MTQLASAKVWYKTWWGIVLTVVFFYVLVPYLVWTKTDWHKALKVAITVACVLFVVGAASDANKKENEAQVLVAQAETYFKDGNVDKADELAKQADDMSDQDNNTAFTDLQNKIRQAKVEQKSKLDSPEFLKSSLAQMSDSDFDLLKKGELKTSFIAYEPFNKQFLVKLKEQAGKRASYIAEIEDKKKLDKVLADLASKQAALEERTKLVEKQFSAWDGSHLQLTRAIKDAMNDPKSYEHVETTYVDKGDYLLVTTDYRGKNAFGAMIRKQVKAKVTIDGTVLEVLEQ